MAVQEIIVVDDGSTDGTGDALRAAFGAHIRYLWQENRGVSAARNHGMKVARGRYLAFLDSDDEWMPEKTQQQVSWLESRREFGMVLCDVILVDQDHREIGMLRRRQMLPVDGRILKWVLLNPSLAPVSAMLRREVFDDVGGFDESLATAEDLDFHLRIAARWPIGVVELPLVRAMREHDGLSALARTYDDYVHVIERAAAGAKGQVDEVDRRRALARAYARNARGLVYLRRWRDAWGLARKAWIHEPNALTRASLLGLAPLAARRAFAALRSNR